MKLNLRIFIGLVLFLGLGFLGSQAMAAETDCTFDKEAEALVALQKNTEIGFQEKTNQELSLRQEILIKIVSCGIDEANNLKAELATVPSQDPNIKKLKDRFSIELDQAVNYYKINGAEIEDLDLLQTKALAKKFLDWRANNFQYTSGGVMNLITWIGNQNFFKVSEHRFNQVAGAVRFVSLGDPESEIPALLKESKLSLDQAKKINDEAWQALKGYSPPEKAMGLIKDSLQKLSDMYAGFLKMNEIITGSSETEDEESISTEKEA